MIDDTFGKGARTFNELNTYLWNAPIAIAIISGDDYKFEVVNDRYLKTINRRREELLGKPAFTVLPEQESQLRHLLDAVRTTGVPFQTEEFPVDRLIDGRMQRAYYSFSYERFHDDQSNTSAIFVTGHDVTEQVLSKIDLIENRDRFKQIADSVPVLMSYVDAKQRYVFNNKWYEEWFGRKSNDVKGKAMKEILGESAYETIAPYIQRVLTGERVSYEAFVKYRHRGDTWIHATYVPDLAKDGSVRGFYVLVEDISDRKKIADVVSKNDSYVRQLADSAPAIIWLTDATGYCFYLNREWYQLTGQSQEEALGFGWLKATHPDDAKSTEIAFRDANEYRMEYRAVFRLRTANGEYRWVVDKGRPRFNDDGAFDGFIGSVIDIDKEMEAEQRIRESEQKYRDLFNTMEQGFCLVEVIFDELKKPVDYRFIEVNPVFANQTGLQNATGRTAREMLPTLEQHWFDLYGKVAATGESAKFSEGSDVMGRWFDVYAFKVGAESSNRVAILFSDVSEKRKAEVQLRDSENKLRALVMATSDVIYQMNPDWTIMRNLDGRGFLSDVSEPISDWMDKFILAEDQQIVSEKIAAAIRAKTFFEMEHRVRQADGSIGWTFSKAVPIFDAEGNIKEWFGAASDVTQRHLAAESLKQSENKYRILANDLEQMVNDRTYDLQRSNEDLERFAHVASHDLKEPVRKVKTYIDRLKSQYGTMLPPKANDYLEKMDRASDRMNMMIEGVLRYSTLNAVEQPDANVDLNHVIDAVIYDLEIVIGQKSAIVNKDVLPTIRGSELLFHQLFYNLINNALKFTRQGANPVIDIRSEKLTTDDLSRIVARKDDAFAKITVSDNGIGFKDSEAINIFETFTRLNPKDQFEGTGLGLALCQKIVRKYNGVMYANGVEGKGATFTILLPV